MASRRDNPRLLCAYRALQMSLFPMAVLTVFFRHDIGMSMTQIMLVQGGFGLAMALFEFPSGYLADRIGYRRTLIFAAMMNAVGWSIYVRADSMLGVLVAEAVLGVAVSLISGSDTALLYETLEERGEELEFGRWTGRIKFFGQFGEGTAAIVAGFLYAYWHRLPFAFEVGIWIINVVIAWRLVEPERERPPLQDNWAQVRAMVRHLAIEDPKLRAITLLTIALGMASFVPVWTVQLYVTDAGLAASWLGVIWAVANYSVAFASLMSTRVAGVLGLGRLFGLCIGLIVLGYAGMGLTHAVWGVVFYYSLTMMRGLYGPSLHHEEQRRVPSSDRAGFISLRSLAFRGCFLVLGPCVGLAIDRYGQHPVLLGVGAFLTIAAVIAVWMMHRSGALVRGKASKSQGLDGQTRAGSP